MNVYSGGTFDMFHTGHVNLLARCRQIAGDGVVTVALNTDEFINQYKGRHPVVPYPDRKTVLEACRYVDRVVPNMDGPDSRTTIERVQPDVIVIGSDWATRDYHTQMGFDQKWLDERGIALCYVPYTTGISSSSLRTRL